MNLVNILIIIVLALCVYLLVPFIFISWYITLKKEFVAPPAADPQNSNPNDMVSGSNPLEGPKSTDTGYATASLQMPCGKNDGIAFPNLPLDFLIKCDEGLQCVNNILTDGLGICMSELGQNCNTVLDCMDTDNTATCLNNICQEEGNVLLNKCNIDEDCSGSGDNKSNYNHICDPVDKRCKVDLAPLDGGCANDTQCRTGDENNDIVCLKNATSYEDFEFESLPKYTSVTGASYYNISLKNYNLNGIYNYIFQSTEDKHYGIVDQHGGVRFITGVAEKIENKISEFKILSEKENITTFTGCSFRFGNWDINVKGICVSKLPIGTSVGDYTFGETQVPCDDSLKESKLDGNGPLICQKKSDDPVGSICLFDYENGKCPSKNSLSKTTSIPDRFVQNKNYDLKCLDYTYGTASEIYNLYVPDVDNVGICSYEIVDEGNPCDIMGTTNFPYYNCKNGTICQNLVNTTSYDFFCQSIYDSYQPVRGTCCSAIGMSYNEEQQICLLSKDSPCLNVFNTSTKKCSSDIYIFNYIELVPNNNLISFYSEDISDFLKNQGTSLSVYSTKELYGFGGTEYGVIINVEYENLLPVITLTLDKNKGTIKTGTSLCILNNYSSNYVFKYDINKREYGVSAKIKFRDNIFSNERGFNYYGSSFMYWSYKTGQTYNYQIQDGQSYTVTANGDNINVLNMYYHKDYIYVLTLYDNNGKNLYLFREDVAIPKNLTINETDIESNTGLSITSFFKGGTSMSLIDVKDLNLKLNLDENNFLLYGNSPGTNNFIYYLENVTDNFKSGTSYYEGNKAKQIFNYDNYSEGEKVNNKYFLNNLSTEDELEVYQTSNNFDIRKKITSDLEFNHPLGKNITYTKGSPTTPVLNSAGGAGMSSYKFEENYINSKRVKAKGKFLNTKINGSINLNYINLNSNIDIKSNENYYIETSKFIVFTNQDDIDLILENGENEIVIGSQVQYKKGNYLSIVNGCSRVWIIKKIVDYVVFDDDDYTQVLQVEVHQNIYTSKNNINLNQGNWHLNYQDARIKSYTWEWEIDPDNVYFFLGNVYKMYNASKYLNYDGELLKKPNSDQLYQKGDSTQSLKFPEPNVCGKFIGKSMGTLLNLVYANTYQLSTSNEPNTSSKDKPLFIGYDNALNNGLKKLNPSSSDDTSINNLLNINDWTNPYPGSDPYNPVMTCRIGGGNLPVDMAQIVDTSTLLGNCGYNMVYSCSYQDYNTQNIWTLSSNPIEDNDVNIINQLLTNLSFDNRTNTTGFSDNLVSSESTLLNPDFIDLFFNDKNIVSDATFKTILNINQSQDITRSYFSLTNTFSLRNINYNNDNIGLFGKLYTFSGLNKEINIYDINQSITDDEIHGGVRNIPNTDSQKSALYYDIISFYPLKTDKPTFNPNNFVDTTLRNFYLKDKNINNYSKFLGNQLTKVYQKDGPNKYVFQIDNEANYDYDMYLYNTLRSGNDSVQWTGSPQLTCNGIINVLYSGVFRNHTYLQNYDIYSIPVSPDIINNLNDLSNPEITTLSKTFKDYIYSYLLFKLLGEISGGTTFTRFKNDILKSMDPSNLLFNNDFYCMNSIFGTQSLTINKFIVSFYSDLIIKPKMDFILSSVQNNFFSWPAKVQSQIRELFLKNNNIRILDTFIKKNYFNIGYNQNYYVLCEIFSKNLDKYTFNYTNYPTTSTNFLIISNYTTFPQIGSMVIDSNNNFNYITNVLLIDSTHLIIVFKDSILPIGAASNGSITVYSPKTYLFKFSISEFSTDFENKPIPIPDLRKPLLYNLSSKTNITQFTLNQTFDFAIYNGSYLPIFNNYLTISNYKLLPSSGYLFINSGYTKSLIIEYSDNNVFDVTGILYNKTSIKPIIVFNNNYIYYSISDPNFSQTFNAGTEVYSFTNKEQLLDNIYDLDDDGNFYIVSGKS